MTLRRWLVPCVLACSAASAAAGAAGVELRHSSFRCPSGLDTGTVEVFLHNRGAGPAEVVEVTLDGVALPVRGVWDAAEAEGKAGEKRIRVYLDPSMALSGKRVLWACLDPNPLPADALGVLQLKLAEKASRLVNIGVRTRDGQTLQKVLPPENRKFSLTGIAFAESRQKLYAYVENKTGGPLHVAQVFVNGQDVTGSATVLPAELPSGEKAPIVLPLARPVPEGSFVFVEVTTKEGPAAMERGRAASYFAVSVDSGGAGPAGLHLDEVPFTDAYTRSLEKTTGRTKYIFSCPMHAYGGDLRRCGDEIVRRCLAYRRLDPVALTGVHICRTAAEKGYFLFGEAADSVRMNPFIQSAYFRPSRERPEHVAQWLTALAKRGCQPHPLFSILDLSASPLPEHETPGVGATPRLGAFYVISRGSRGVLYRFGSWLQTPQGRAEVAALNAELQSLKPLLSVAEPYGPVPASTPFAEATLLTCGDLGALLVAINHTGLPQAAGGEGVRRPLRNVKVSIPARGWLSAKEVSPAPPPEGAASRLVLAREGDGASFVIPELNEARAFLIR
ncbi:MAG TPA: hypothetical protein VM031_02555 [Phycisphaerae bacterium]|nr:hypothetical protein [Phycisphaerae bacterium]